MGVAIKYFLTSYKLATTISSIFIKLFLAEVFCKYC